MMISSFTEKERHLCSERVKFWRGKSGRRYAHTVYPAEACPEMSNAIYLAVGRDGNGSRRPLAIDGKQAFDTGVQSIPGTPRMPGEEVHVYLLARSDKQMTRVIEDLCAEYGLPTA